jgi:hypothetical protein
MDVALTREVRARAGRACEYCRMPEAFYLTIPFPIDHIIARQHGGPTTRAGALAGVDPPRYNLLRSVAKRDRETVLKAARWMGSGKQE